MCSDLVFNNFTAAFNSNFYWIFHINLYFAANRFVKKCSFEYACLFFFHIVYKQQLLLTEIARSWWGTSNQNFFWLDPSNQPSPCSLWHSAQSMFSKSPTHTRKPWRRDEVLPRVAGYNQHLLIHKSVECLGFKDSQMYVYSLLLSLPKFLSFLASEFCFLSIRLLYRRQMSSSTFLGWRLFSVTPWEFSSHSTKW